MMKFCRWPLLLMMVVTACGLAQAQPVMRNGIVAIVNDSVITFQELESFTSQAVEVLQRSFRNQPSVFRERYNETIKDGLDQLIQRQLILGDFETSGGTLNESYIDDEIQSRIRRQYGDRATLTKTLQRRGMTFEAFRQRTREEIIIGFMRRMNVASALVISPAKIERYYTNHLDKYQVGEQVKLRMIVLNRPSSLEPAPVERLAREIRSKITEGADFAEMAKVYSEGSTRQEGGNWDWVERSRLNAGLSEVAFGLQTNDLSRVLALAREPNEDYWIYQYDAEGRLFKARKYTGRDVFIEEKEWVGDQPPENMPAPQEFYLMLVEDRRDARTRPLNEVRDEIEKELEVEEQARLEKKWIDKLARKSFVLRLGPGAG